MTPSEIRNLCFRRQYLISPIKINCPFEHQLRSITNTAFLYSHVDLNVSDIQESGRRLILLGDLFDYENTNYTNLNILNVLIRLDFTGLLTALSRYCGRFVLIYVENNIIKITHDAASSRKIYFIRNTDGVYCASQPHLIAKILKLDITREQERQSFYTSSQPIFELLHNSNIGNLTCYDDIYQVLPNHYFDFNNCRSIRFWPNTQRVSLPVDEVVRRGADMIKGFMESICNRYSVMLPVTAGKDSRLLLAASLSNKERIFYYINKGQHMNDSHHDLVIPGRLMPKLNLKFNVLNPDIIVDKDFERIYFENNPFASKRFLPIIYNYYLNFSDRINLPATFSASSLRVYRTNGKPLDATVLASFIKVEKFGFAKKYFAEWLNECQSDCHKYNYDVLNLLYWEERMGNWGTEIQLNKDLAQDEIIPFNSRLFVDTLLSAPVYAREKPDFVILREITRKLWPETLLEPYNINLRRKSLTVLKKIGIHNLVLKFYYTLKPVLKHFKSA